MFKLVVLSVVLAVVAAKPGYLHGGLVAAPIALPAAVSHSSRIDIHSKPIAVVKTAPVIAVHSAPAYVSAPIAHSVIAAPISYATSHSSRYDVHNSVPVVASYGYGHGGYGLGLGQGTYYGGLHGW